MYHLSKMDCFMEQKFSNNKVTSVLRWIVFLPLSILGSYAGHLIVIYLNQITMSDYIDPNSFLGQVFLRWLGYFVFGFLFVYIAAYVAPGFKKQVIIGMAGLLLLFSGAFLLLAIVKQNYWFIFGIICMNLGSAGVAFELFKKQTECENQFQMKEEYTINEFH